MGEQTVVERHMDLVASVTARSCGFVETLAVVW
jgi:hypothetical protein